MLITMSFLQSGCGRKRQELEAPSEAENWGDAHEFTRGGKKVGRLRLGRKGPTVFRNHSTHKRISGWYKQTEPNTQLGKLWIIVKQASHPEPSVEDNVSFH